MIDFNRTAAPIQTDAPPLAPDQTITALAPLDSNRACAEFITFVEEMNVIKKLATSLVIIDADGLKEATRIGTQAKKLAKDIKEKEKDITGPAATFVKSVGNYCKNFIQPLTEIESAMRVKISQYQANIELERRRAEEAARKAREALQQELDAKAKKDGVAPVTVPEIVMPKEDGIVRTDEAGMSYQKKIWKAEIIDENLVPREYCTPDSRKINDAVKMGCREIPGVEIKEVSTTVFRT